MVSFRQSCVFAGRAGGNLYGGPFEGEEDRRCDDEQRSLTQGLTGRGKKSRDGGAAGGALAQCPRRCGRRR